MEQIYDFEDANEAVFEENKILRVQPKAPAPTYYYYVTETDGWVKHTAGLSPKPVAVETIRDDLERHFPKHTRVGGGVFAASREKVTDN